jgi:GNAT superfamily N-acetyltransferase
MATKKLSPDGIIRRLDEHLVLRRATPQDTEKLVEFNARVHSDDGWEQPFEPVGTWVRDLMTKEHPTFRPELFTIVEDTRTGEIVSSLNTIPQTWTYAGIPIEVGRPELVGTHPDYRNRGLIRAQFEEIHRWGAARGELMQVITGIPYYYRLFGYEMTVNLSGGRTGYTANLPKLAEGENEPFRIRPAQSADLPFIRQVYDHGAGRSLLSCQRDAAIWEYELHGHAPTSVNRRALQIIARAEDGEPVGFIGHPPVLWGSSQAITEYELKPGVSWLGATPTVIRYAFQTGQEHNQSGDKPCEAYTFTLGAEHPAYEAALDLLPRQYQAYAYYIRVPDLGAFLHRIRPVLEARLAASIAPAYSGELKISFYIQGLRLAFERGRLAAIEKWQPAPHGQSGDAVFPGLTFLQLIFGYRSLEELKFAFPDVIQRGDAARVLLNALFPKKNSCVWPVN